MSLFERAFSFLNCTHCKKFFGYYGKVLSCENRSNRNCFDHEAVCGKCMHDHAESIHAMNKQRYITEFVARRHEIEEKIRDFLNKMETKFFDGLIDRKAETSNAKPAVVPSEIAVSAQKDKEDDDDEKSADKKDDDDEKSYYAETQSHSRPVSYLEKVKPGIVANKPRSLPDDEIRESWRTTVTDDLRNHFAKEMIFEPTIHYRVDQADPRYVQLSDYAKKLEDKLYKKATSTEDYVHLMAEKIRVIQMKLAHRRDFFDLDDDLPEIVEMINCVANGRAVDDQPKWCKSSKECVDDALKKDPDTPKRSMSAFFWWLAENRARIKKDGMGVAEVGKVAGKEWGVLKDKSKWEKLADKDRQRYESELAAYKKFSSIQNVHTI